jgi:hypothetical protein
VLYDSEAPEGISASINNHFEFTGGIGLILKLRPNKMKTLQLIK